MYNVHTYTHTYTQNGGNLLHILLPKNKYLNIFNLHSVIYVSTQTCTYIQSCVPLPLACTSRVMLLSKLPLQTPEEGCGLITFYASFLVSLSSLPFSGSTVIFVVIECPCLKNGHTK